MSTAPPRIRLQLKPRQHVCRFHFFHGTLRLFEAIDLLHYFVRFNWPETAALLDKLVDDSSQFFFFSIIEHTIGRGRAYTCECSPFVLGADLLHQKPVGDSDSARNTSWEVSVRSVARSCS